MVLLNHDRALALMRHSGLDALVATSARNVLYFSDYYCWLDPLFKGYMTRPGASSDLSHNFAVLPAAGPAALVVPAIWAGNTVESWIDDLWLHSVGDLDLSVVPTTLDGVSSRLLDQVERGRSRADGVGALRDLLQERGLSEARIGVELDGLSATERSRIAEALPRAEVLDCSNLLRLIRMIKTAEEIARLERSARINVQVAEGVLSGARAGTRISELRSRYIAGVVEAGALLDHFIVSPHGIGIQQTPEYQLADRDVLYVDYGCVYQHYYSDNGTTLVIGDFSKEMEQRYAVLLAGLAAGIEKLRPGVLPSDVRRAMIDTLAEGGITGSNAHGHGVGLEVRDYPIIMPATGLRIHDDCVDVSSDVPLEPGMVVNLELPLFLFGTGSLHMEETFLITADGSRRLDGDRPTHAVQVGMEVARA